MKQECPTYLKTIGKSKTLAATLNDTKLEDDSNNENDGILNAFTATVNPTKGIVNIHTAYAKLYKVLEKYENMYRLTTKKLSDIELEREELSTKFDEANQTIKALRFENNFLVEKTNKRGRTVPSQNSIGKDFKC